MLEVARRILAEAGRPLSARKILELAEREGGAPLDLALLREALEGASDIREVRRGVFELAPPAPPAPPPVETADDDEGDDDRKRRRRRPRAKELLSEQPVAALTVEAAVAQAEAATDSESLRRDLWTQVRDRAAAAVTQEALPPVADLMEEEPAPRRSRKDARSRRSERGEGAAEQAPVAPAPVAPAPVAPASVAQAPVAQAPVAPAPVAQAPVAQAPAPVARAQSQEKLNENGGLRAALRARIKAAAAAAPTTPRVVAPPPVPLAPTPRQVATDPVADVQARLAARRRVRPAQAIEIPVAPLAPAPTPVVAAAPVVAVAAAAPAVAAALAPAVAAPAVSAVAAPEAAPPAVVVPRADRPAPAPAPPALPASPIAPETRPPRPPEEGIAQQVRALLLAENRSAAVRRLADRLGEETSAVRNAMVADNARQSAAGRRPLFVFLPDGSVGLSEWTLSERYLDLEDKIQHALVEQEEMVRHDLRERVAHLDDGAFEHVVTLLLERLGHEQVHTVHRQGSTLALLTLRDGEPVAVVARRASTVVGLETVQALEASLPRFDAARGLLITVGGFDERARAAARRGGVRLLDGPALARALYHHDIGVCRHQPTLRYPDAAFFASLG